MPAPSPDLTAPAWRAFAEAATVEDFYRGWLAVQCRLVAGVGAAVVLGVDAGRVQSASPLAVWGRVGRISRPLLEASKRALAERRRVVVQHQIESRHLWLVALPVQARGCVVGTVAFALTPRSEPELQDALRHLEWGSGWLEALALRQTTASQPTVEPSVAEEPPSTAADRLQTLMDLVAT